MNLQWNCKESLENHNSPLSVKNNVKINYSYKDITNENIRRKNIVNGRESLVNVKNRKIIHGKGKGNKTSHWINSPYKIGKNIPIEGKNFTIKNTSLVTSLKDFGKVETTIVEYSDKRQEIKLDSNEKYEDYEFKRIIWFHKKTGLKIKENLKRNYKHIQMYGDIGTFSYSKEESLICEIRENNVDNDNDTFTDLEELLKYNTNPLSNDTDNDGIKDNIEIIKNITNPLSNDTDNDGVIDGEEITNNITNPLLNDTDNDGIIDGEEIKKGTDPNKKNTDGDWWDDKKDINPDSKISPLIYYILGIILLIGIVILLILKKRKSTSKNKIAKIKDKL